MNKIVKILLIILAAMLVAAGGFWSGTQFAFQRPVSSAAGDINNAAVVDVPPTTITPTGPGQMDSNRPQGDRQNDGPQLGMRDRFGKDGNDNTLPDRGYGNQPGDNRQNNGTNDRPRAMAGNPALGDGSGQNRPGNNNFGSGLNMQKSNANQMMDRHNGGFNTMSIGGMFMGGGMMLFGLLFPLGFAILMVLGIIVLYRMVRKPSVIPVVGTAECAKCGGTVQNDWKFCPHCGEPK